MLPTCPHYLEEYKKALSVIEKLNFLKDVYLKSGSSSDWQKCVVEKEVAEKCRNSFVKLLIEPTMYEDQLISKIEVDILQYMESIGFSFHFDGFEEYAIDTHLVAIDISEVPESLQSLEKGFLYLHHFQQLKTVTISDAENLHSLPKLPDTITDFALYGSPINTIEHLPASLEQLTFQNCSQLSHVSIFPTQLLSLSTDECPKFTVLPHLPDTIKMLFLDSETTSTKEKLPDSLENISASSAFLNSIQEFPPHLETLTCKNKPKRFDLSKDKKTTSLPTNLPASLEYLGLVDCFDISPAPVYPPHLEMLVFSSRFLTTIPKIPKGITTLNFYDCARITKIPTLPPGILEISLTGSCSQELAKVIDAYKKKYPSCIVKR